MNLLIITFKRNLNSRFDKITDREIIDVFNENLKSKGVDKITIEDDSNLKFENYLFSLKPGGNLNLWLGIKNGAIKISSTENKRVLKYSFNILYDFIFAIAISLVLLIWSESNFLTIFGFFAIGLLGSIVTLIPHSDNLTEILNCVLKKTS